MSIQSDAAKKHIETLLAAIYPDKKNMYGYPVPQWDAEWHFNKDHLKKNPKTGRMINDWRFDYAVPSLKVAIELDGGTFQQKRTGHSSGVGLRAWREKNNAAMSAGWRVWHYAPEEVIKAGRKTLSDEPILKRLPWLSIVDEPDHVQARLI